MNRRTLLRRFLAIAAAVAIAPKMGTAEAAPVKPLQPIALRYDTSAELVYAIDRHGDFSMGPAIDTLTFEAMQADCAARGCELELQPERVYEDGTRWMNIRHLPDGRITQANLTYVGGLGIVLARVDVWRCLLHKEPASEWLHPTVIEDWG